MDWGLGTGKRILRSPCIIDYQLPITNYQLQKTDCASPWVQNVRSTKEAQSEDTNNSLASYSVINYAT